MKSLLIALTLVSSSAFAGSDAVVKCHTGFGTYTITVKSPIGTIAVPQTSDIKLVSFKSQFERQAVKFAKSRTAQAHIDEDGKLSAVFFADFEGSPKRIRLDAVTRTIKTLDVNSGSEELEREVVCDAVALDT